MPLAMVRYNPREVSISALSVISERLPQTVASALHTEDGQPGAVTADEVAVQFSASATHVLDVNGHDIDIVVFAHDVEARRVDLAERRALAHMELANSLRIAGQRHRMSLWIMLVHGSYHAW